MENITCDRSDSIFRKYYSNQPFVDRFLTDPGKAMDVIIPVIHTNELWEINLISLYREIPINRLLISDGGCIDDSLEVARNFPRMTIFDHRNYTSLGYCIRKLIEAVETEWFVYPHSDVYLPDGWFDTMIGHQDEYDWFASPQHQTIMAERVINETRPSSGCQMGRKAAFQEGLAQIDDDFMYRQEDHILVSLVEQAGFKHGRIKDTFHYHQMMHKPGPWSREIKSVSIEVEIRPEERVRTSTMHVKGLIKYLNPTPLFVQQARRHIGHLIKWDKLDWDEFRQWVMETNPTWWPYIRYSKYEPFKHRLGTFLKATYYLIFGRQYGQTRDMSVD